MTQPSRSDVTKIAAVTAKLAGGYSTGPDPFGHGYVVKRPDGMVFTDYRNHTIVFTKVDAEKIMQLYNRDRAGL